ncbi:glycoside hydrolase family 105 protein [Bacteroides sp. 51]|uniref:glycoside hydrolase family 88/105 protein n=1 Tax=Bacteroides sp. 51 TaxID=2302938 RepID=UPI0013D0D2AD|nr:glycoside hydrolase family 88 protein [Bacteroides sp. 51]NDV83282.1 glycoside hydrolase family 88 protein [Bacteroides sp. 51]
MKRITNYLSFFFLLTITLSGCAEKKTDNELWSERMARSEMKRFPEPWMIEKATKPRWGYTHGLVVKAMLEEWKHTGNKDYYDYAKIYADSLIDANGKICMNYLSFNIDNINAGKILFDFYEQTSDNRYKVAMDTLRKQMVEQPRTKEGGYWHKLKYTHQMWLDGIFMASPYLAEYGTVFGDTTVYADVINQITLIARHTCDPETGLYYHGWDESKEQKWADPVTGCSPNFWSRSLGWYAAALVDVLDYLPKETTGREAVLSIIENLATSLAKYQDAESGTWYQVTIEGNREGNYLESSATALFVYFYAKAINQGYIGHEYEPVVRKAFDGMIKEFIREEPDGTYTITNCCAVAGLGGDSRYRDGSFEYYISEPVIDNDPKSVGSFILAAIEYEKMTASPQPSPKERE